MSFLNTKIINSGPEIFGLDLSDLSVKVLQLEKSSDNVYIKGFAVESIPAGNIDDGRIINKKIVADIIRKAVSKASPKKIKTKNVICSIPESKIFLRVIDLPKISEDEAREAVKWEMEGNIPIPIEQVYYDWQFLSLAKKTENKNQEKQEILTVAVGKDVVDDLTEVLEMAGLNVLAMEAESIATVRSLINMYDGHDQAVMIVDLSAENTNFIVVNKGVPMFTSSVPFCASGIDKAIAGGFHISLKESEKLKIAHGIESSQENPIFEAASAILENLVGEITKTLDFYGELLSEAEIEKIILCGGGARLKGLQEFLAGKINKDIQLGDVWANIDLKNKASVISEESAIRYPTVVGLAMRGMEYEN